MIRYFLRAPRFPVICDQDGYLVGAFSEEEFVSQLENANPELEESYPLLDPKGEGWSLVMDQIVVSPLAFKKTWTKREVIELFNSSDTASKAGLVYSLKSLSNKRLDLIVSELAALIPNVNQPPNSRDR